MKNIYMYVQDTMADWEHGYLMHALSLYAMLGSPNIAYKLSACTKFICYVRRT